MSRRLKEDLSVSWQPHYQRSRKYLPSEPAASIAINRFRKLKTVEEDESTREVRNIKIPSRVHSSSSEGIRIHCPVQKLKDPKKLSSSNRYCKSSNEQLQGRYMLKKRKKTKMRSSLQKINKRIQEDNIEIKIERFQLRMQEMLAVHRQIPEFLDQRVSPMDLNSLKLKNKQSAVRVMVRALSKMMRNTKLEAFLCFSDT